MLKKVLLSLIIMSLMMVSFEAMARPGRGGNRAGIDHSAQRPMKKTQVNSAWEKKADRNNNGWVDPYEQSRATHTRPQGQINRHHRQRPQVSNDNHNGSTPNAQNRPPKKKKYQVNSSQEKKADQNGNGWVDPKEKNIAEHKKHEVNSALEEKMDRNGDDVVDSKEHQGFINRQTEQESS